MGSKIGNIQKEESGPRFSDPRVINDFGWRGVISPIDSELVKFVGN